MSPGTVEVTGLGALVGAGLLATAPFFIKLKLRRCFTEHF